VSVSSKPRAQGLIGRPPGMMCRHTTQPSHCTKLHPRPRDIYTMAWRSEQARSFRDLSGKTASLLTLTFTVRNLSGLTSLWLKFPKGFAATTRPPSLHLIPQGSLKTTSVEPLNQKKIPYGCRSRFIV